MLRTVTQLLFSGAIYIACLFPEIVQFLFVFALVWLSNFLCEADGVNTI